MWSSGEPLDVILGPIFRLWLGLGDASLLTLPLRLPTRAHRVSFSEGLRLTDPCSMPRCTNGVSSGCSPVVIHVLSHLHSACWACRGAPNRLRTSCPQRCRSTLEPAYRFACLVARFLVVGLPYRGITHHGIAIWDACCSLMGHNS
jgi:hypothetical protein